MKTIWSKLFLIAAFVLFAEVNGIPQGKKVEDEEKPKVDFDMPLSTLNRDLINLKKLREEIPDFIKNFSELDSRGPPHSQPQLGLGIGTLYNTLLGGVQSLYQDLLNRQQAFINLLTCGNCVNDGWEAIMDVALTLPELEWVYRPSESSAATFFTAVHQNGTVTGIGGSIVNGKPVAEYAFRNDGIKQHLTEKQKQKISGS